MKQFGYAYLNGTNLLQTLTMPNNMSLTQSFEEKRDLLTQMDYKRGATLVTRRQYTYDTLARPLTRTTSRQGQTINDSFVHTYRSELASAQVNGETYGYDYDNIGNRRMAMEASDYAFYEANNLNQYSSIQRNEEEAFVPSFDADGNQTLVRTTTGIWSVSYNAENRPVIFQKTTDSVTTRITCSYDSMGRRATKKVEEITTDAEGNESITVISNHRFIYRGYLQIACCDLTRNAHPCLWLITWDPTQPVATRPLAIQKDGTWFCYGWDLTKNICEVFGQNGYIRTAYSYTPYGNVTANGDITQPIQWSSEYDDTELALTYYNFRHYNPMDGRWLGRDKLQEQENILYNYCNNAALYKNDYLGASVIPLISTTNEMIENNVDMIKSMKDGITLEYSAFSLQGSYNPKANLTLPECPDYYGIAIYGLSFDIRGIVSLSTAILAKVHFYVYYETNSCHINFLGLRLMDTAYVSEGSPISFHIKGTPQSTSYIKGTCRCCAQSACVKYKVEISSKKKGLITLVPDHIITTKSITIELQICAGLAPKKLSAKQRIN